MVKIEVYIFKMIKSFSEKGTSIIGTFQELEFMGAGYDEDLYS